MLLVFEFTSSDEHDHFPKLEFDRDSGNLL